MFDVVMLWLSAVLINYLGLIEAVEGVIKHKIPIVNCSKCLSFLVVLTYTLLSGYNVIGSIATSFICAYAVRWIELLLGYADHLYMKVYEKIYSDNKTKDTSEDTAEEVS